MASDQTMEQDVLHKLVDLHKQATLERSHNYVGSVVIDAIGEITRLRFENSVMRADLAEIRGRVRPAQEGETK